MLSMGQAQTLSAVFTPNDTDDYKTVKRVDNDQRHHVAGADPGCDRHPQYRGQFVHHLRRDAASDLHGHGDGGQLRNPRRGRNGDRHAQRSQRDHANRRERGISITFNTATLPASGSAYNVSIGRRSKNSAPSPGRGSSAFSSGTLSPWMGSIVQIA